VLPLQSRTAATHVQLIHTVVLPFDKVALAFMRLAQSFERISHYISVQLCGCVHRQPLLKCKVSEVKLSLGQAVEAYRVVRC
jgi:hypothetical protein